MRIPRQIAPDLLNDFGNKHGGKVISKIVLFFQWLCDSVVSQPQVMAAISVIFQFWIAFSQTDMNLTNYREYSRAVDLGEQGTKLGRQFERIEWICHYGYRCS